MTRFIELAQANVESAQAIVRTPSFDDTAAELLMRNAAVITDRLKADEFWSLPRNVGSKAIEAADIAISLAPLDLADTIPLPFETKAEHIYRLTVWQPLHSLQSKIAERKFDSDNNNEVTTLKRAVSLGSTAFAAVLLASEANPSIIETERYFWGNTDAAVGRIQRATGR